MTKTKNFKKKDDIWVWVGQAQALQKPLRLGHSHASMAATLALHGFAGWRLSPAVGVRGRPFGAEARGNRPPFTIQNSALKGQKHAILQNLPL